MSIAELWTNLSCNFSSLIFYLEVQFPKQRPKLSVLIGNLYLIIAVGIISGFREDNYRAKLPTIYAKFDSWISWDTWINIRKKEDLLR